MYCTSHHGDSRGKEINSLYLSMAELKRDFTVVAALANSSAIQHKVNIITFYKLRN